MPYGHYIKKSMQSLRPSTRRIGWDFFSKIGIEWGTYFSKKVPNFEIIWRFHATPRALILKGVYEVSYSRYVQIFESMCTLISNDGKYKFSIITEKILKSIFSADYISQHLLLSEYWVILTHATRTESSKSKQRFGTIWILSYKIKITMR